MGQLHRVNEAPTWLPMETAQAEMSMRSQELFAKVAEMLPQMQRNACKLDRESEFPTAEVEQLVAGGALAAVVPVRYAGLGMGTESSGALHLFDLLRLIGRGNLAVGRIFEGHVNAIALVALYGSEKQLAQASQDALSGHLFAIWNTEPPEGLRIVGRELTGSKIFCSAAGHATRAMVTAKDENGESRMLLLALQPGERTATVAFRPQGMRAATTQKVVLDGFSISSDAFIGQPDDYMKEPAFSAGAWRASAVAIGGLEALIEETRTQLMRGNRHCNPHQQARMGRAIIAQETARMWGRRAALIAGASDAESEDKAAYVNLARSAIEAATANAIRLIQRSLGLAAFLEPNPAERLMRDLGTYLRQPAPDEALTEAAAWFIEKGCGLERLGS
jgi:alkylation response protein AidB-like acyl-CoA dehydrogenase